jgi:hypothetical protein
VGVEQCQNTIVYRVLAEFLRIAHTPAKVNVAQAKTYKPGTISAYFLKTKKKPLHLRQIIQWRLSSEGTTQYLASDLSLKLDLEYRRRNPDLAEIFRYRYRYLFVFSTPKSYQVTI